MRFTSLFIIASTFSIVFALPVAVPKDQSLSKSSTDVGSDVIPSLARRFEVESDELLDRDTSDLFRRAKINNYRVFNLGSKNQIQKAAKYNSELFKSHRENFPRAHHDLPQSPELSLHIGVPHVGGANPNEPLHSTVVIRGKKNDPIQSPHQVANVVTTISTRKFLFPIRKGILPREDEPRP